MKKIKQPQLLNFHPWKWDSWDICSLKVRRKRNQRTRSCQEQTQSNQLNLFLQKRNGPLSQKRQRTSHIWASMRSLHCVSGRWHTTPLHAVIATVLPCLCLLPFCGLRACPDSDLCRGVTRNLFPQISS